MESVWETQKNTTAWDSSHLARHQQQAFTSASHWHTACTMCVCVYLLMPLLNRAFRPHTYQLHSISWSTEADRLAGPCYITTLHSIYNSLCTKLTCTRTDTQEQKPDKPFKTKPACGRYDWQRHVKHTQAKTTRMDPPLLSIPLCSVLCSKTMSLGGVMVRSCQWQLLPFSSSRLQWRPVPLSQPLPVSLWPSARNFMTPRQGQSRWNNISCDWRIPYTCVFAWEVFPFTK